MLKMTLICHRSLSHKTIGIILVIAIFPLLLNEVFADFGSSVVISSNGRVVDIGNIFNNTRPLGTDLEDSIS